RFAGAHCEGGNKDERLDGRHGQDAMEYGQSAYGAAQIAAVKPEQRHCGRGEDQGGRQRRLERHPARHIVIGANGRGQGQRLPEFTKPTTGEEKKLKTNVENSAAPISDFETSQLSGVFRTLAHSL